MKKFSLFYKDEESSVLVLVLYSIALVACLIGRAFYLIPLNAIALIQALASIIHYNRKPK